MMFTLQQLQAAHAQVKTGADFPAYVQAIKALGLDHYDYLVHNGATYYYSIDGQEIKGDAQYAELYINPQSSAEQLRHTIKIHQQGQTDFMTFCKQAAEAGVTKWEVNTRSMLCIYWDQQGNSLVEEPIPDAKSY